MLILGASNTVKSQEDSISKTKFLLNGYLETYYLFDLSEPINQQRPYFYVSHTRHNEFNLNLGLIRFSAENKRYKTALAFMTGSYTSANMINEKGFFRYINEANIAFQLAKKRKIWLQIGIFNSHIGFESAIGADCFNLTRSIAADNSPYFETGARLNYQSKNKHWDLSFLVLNGWQRIQRLPNNSMPSFGTQVCFSKNNILINSSTYIGNEGTDASPHWRYFHNFYLIKKVASKNHFIIGFDTGIQRFQKKTTSYFWCSPQLVYQYQLTKKMKIATRIEYYNDKDAIITVPLKTARLKVWGASFNMDYQLINSVCLRLEYKLLNNPKPIFLTENKLSNYNSCIAAALAIKF
jgi:hypothetical protein